MRYTVTWHPSAEQELADIWLESTDRNEITQAANSLDHLLSSDPLTQGEEFYGDRILVVLPIAITYTVSEPDRSVRILQVWHQ
jgi:hypothetical protein